MKFCNQDISKTTTAMSFKFGQLIALCKFGHRKFDISKSITAMSFKLGQARIFLLVDLREYFFRFRVEGTKKNIKKALKMTS